MDKLKVHNIVLKHETITLRPLSEKDWTYLYRWNNDEEVLYYTEGDNVEQLSMDDIKEMYSLISQKAYCFVIEYNNCPIGECWLQQLNLPRLLEQYPNLDCRRIDIMIGEKEYWCKGLGRKIIVMLTKYGFEHEAVDMIFGCDIADYNKRSLRAFEHAGFRIHEAVDQPSGHKANVCIDVKITRDEYEYLKKLGHYQTP